MRVPLKYGLLVALGAIAWVVVAHLLVPDLRSVVHTVGPGIFFNVLHIAGIFLAIAASKNEAGGQMTFKQGLKTGVATAVVFAITMCLFFVVALFIFGAKLMASEPGMETLPPWKTALAFAGLGLGTIVLGLIYSTLISFFLAKRVESADQKSGGKPAFPT